MSQAQAAHTTQEYMERAERTRWFAEARFGMFIHWGVYAIPARGEWVRSTERQRAEDYQSYLEAFDPVHYRPREWAKAARDAGMKYAVMTAKHHDGFCMFDSRLTNYKVTNTPAGRDLLREYVEAFRAEGLRVGLYYSLLDWHHEDYPAYGDSIHPLRGDEACRDRSHEFSNYVAYMHGQVEELLTHYGKIDIIWFDFSYDDMRGEVWGATELVRKARAFQPDILIDDRLGGNIRARHPEPYAGDFASPEQIIPPEGVLNEDGLPLPWEACITLNNHWGYCAADRDYKSAKQVIRALIECVGKGGNLLLNVGPDAKGEIPEPSLRLLEEVGTWMRRNGASVYGCGRSDLPKPQWGWYTKHGSRLYAHLYDRGIGLINLRGLNGRIVRARMLDDGSEVKVRAHRDYPEDAFLSYDGGGLPDERDTVVVLELDDAEAAK